MDENFATILETIADLRPGRVVVSHGERTRTWAEFDDEAARLAGHLAGQGVGPEDRVAIGLYNGIEYLVTVFAAMKLRAVPCNVNYRYRRDELVALLTDARAAAVVFDASLAGRLGEARADLPGLHTAIQVGGEDAVPPWATRWSDAVRADPAPRTERGNDSWLMYTGGTTGRPKGVLVRHSWLYGTVCANGFLLLGEPFPQSLDELRATLERLGLDRDSIVCLPAPPLMHGTGMYTSLSALLAGGRVVYLASTSYDPDELAATVGREHVDTVSVVGDVFARPLADALDRAAEGGRPYDLSSLRRVLSVGVAWSAEVKERLLRHADIVCRDLVAASEGGPFAVSETRRGEEASTARFRLVPGARVVDDTGHDVAPGSGQVGLLAAPADPWIRYDGDDSATASVFREFDGRRWVVPGDMAEVEADGTVVFHGRGSRVINTGGEKVYAEEVEQTLLTHPAVRDAMVVGAPDERFGSRIVAVVALRPGAALTTAEARAFVGERLADHKRPRDLVVVEELRRSPSGKADLRWARQIATTTPWTTEETAMSTPLTVDGVEGARGLVGTQLGPTDGVQITQEMVNLFAEATGDHQWIHVDVERAKAESPFGGPIAHGYLTLSLIPRFLPQLVEFTGFSMGVNYGTEKVRFPAPVPVGSTLRASAVVDEVSDIAGGVQIRQTVTFEVEGSPKPVCVATIIVRQYV